MGIAAEWLDALAMIEGRGGSVSNEMKCRARSAVIAAHGLGGRAIPRRSTHGWSRQWTTRDGLRLRQRAPARAAYQWSVEVTAYVAESARRQGRRTAALRAACSPCCGRRVSMAPFAGIALPNDASVRLHEAVGFRRWVSIGKSASNSVLARCRVVAPGTRRGRHAAVRAGELSRSCVQCPRSATFWFDVMVNAGRLPISGLAPPRPAAAASRDRNLAAWRMALALAGGL